MTSTLKCIVQIEYLFSETHPLLSAKSSRDKVNQPTKKTGKSRQHRVSSHSENKTSHKSKHGNKKDKFTGKYSVL